MPPVTITPAAAPLAPSPPPPAFPATQNPPTMPDVPATIGTNDGANVRMPTVAAPRMKIAGAETIDRGDDADFHVLHHRVGRFASGDRLAASDLAGSDIPWLLSQGAVEQLREPAAIREALAADDAKPSKSKS